MSPEPKLNALIPEFLVTDVKTSIEFYTNVLGFHILYQSKENNFAMMEREGAQIMLNQIDPQDAKAWIAAPLEAPFGRGMNLDILATNVDNLYAKVQASNANIFLPIEERWFRADETDLGFKIFIVLDPDGYLLRFSQSIGTRTTQKQ